MPDMYNKLFTKILDSSIWMEDTATRLVWVTLLAAMDEEGMCLFAAPRNLAHRARIPLKDVERAVLCLEGADPDSSDPENDGRRIERVPGGWIVLNAKKYRDLVTREVAKERTRLRVAKFREKKAAGNVHVTSEKRPVTPSDAVTEASSDSHSRASERPAGLPELLAHASSNAIPANVAEVFWSDCEARPLGVSGRWTFRDGSEMRDWRKALKSFSLRWDNNDRRSTQPRNGHRGIIPAPPDNAEF